MSSIKSLFFAMLFFGQVSAQSYEITLQLDGLDTGTVSLGYFFGAEKYLADSARAAGGSVTFRNDGPLAEGMYFAGTKAGQLLDFMVDSVQVFTLKGKILRPDSMEVIGASDENRAFFAHKKAISPLLAQLEQGRQMFDLLQKSTRDPEVLREQRENLNGIYRKITLATEAHIAENPGRLYTKMLKMGFSPTPPPEVTPKRDGHINPAYIDWVRAHYFDNVDFGDSRLLYCNVFSERVGGFMRDYFPQTGEGMAAACDMILAKTAPSMDYNVWAVVNLTRLFEGDDWGPGATVFTHLVDKYQQPGQQVWLDEATQMRLQYKADVWRPNLLGKDAPPLRLFDQEQMIVDLKTVDAPLTMLVFYSPLCDHCQEQLPEIYQNYLTFKEKGLKCLAISTDANREVWLDFLKKQNWEWTNLIETAEKSQVEKDYAAFNLPIIYLLDKDKKIVGRRVKTKELGAVLGNLLK